MFTHNTIWEALDKLARAYSTTPSGLAKQAGLDPTTFNKSKRQTAQGKNRWPSTESLAKVLSVLDMNFEDFAQFTSKTPHRGPAIPVIGLAQAGSEGFFDDAGFPVGAGWDEVHVPGVKDENIYALEINGDSISPVLRHGDRVLVAPNTNVRRGDRVVVKTKTGEVMAKELGRMTTRIVELSSLNPEYEDRVLDKDDVLWIARIIWASQ